jgi:hypothetical protein
MYCLEVSFNDVLNSFLDGKLENSMVSPAKKQYVGPFETDILAHNHKNEFARMKTILNERIYSLDIIPYVPYMERNYIVIDLPELYPYQPTHMHCTLWDLSECSCWSRSRIIRSEHSYSKN